MIPMRASAAAWNILHPDVRVEWTARPLEQFNDQPLAELIDRYDILVVDHPFVGTAERDRLLTPLDGVLDRRLLAKLDADSVGPSHRSYFRNGRQWGLATDAACHVSASRKDLLAAPPRTWSEIAELARSEPGRVAWPMYPTDCICSLLTLYVSAGGVLEEDSPGLDTGIAADAVAYMAATMPNLHQEALALNPPRVLRRMADTDEIAFVPLTFGYRIFTTPASGAPITFAPAPSHDGRPGPAILGGAGVALSAKARNIEAAVAYMNWLAEPETQREIIAGNEGQPGTRSAWMDPEADRAAGRFFSATLPGISASWVRPRADWWPEFQEHAGHLLRRALERRAHPSAVVADLNELWAKSRSA
jgi:multiple sugar transport system substrate-binding protein